MKMIPRRIMKKFILSVAVACAVVTGSLNPVLATGTPPPGANDALLCPDKTGPKYLGKPFQPTEQSSFCDKPKPGSDPHRGVDLMEKEGYLAPIPRGCKIMMNKDSSGKPSVFWCEGAPQGDHGYGWYMRMACGFHQFDSGKEYKIEVRLSHIKGYDADSQQVVLSCSGCVGQPPHLHYETIVEGRKVNPSCVWGEQQYNKVGCPAELGQPADLCLEKDLELLYSGACSCPGPGCGGPQSITTYNYDTNAVDPSTLSGMHSPLGIPCIERQGDDILGGPTRPYQPGPLKDTDGPEGPRGDGGTGKPTGQGSPSNYMDNNAGCRMCCCPCTDPIIADHNRIRRHVDIFPELYEASEFEEHRKWLAFVYFQEHILRAMMMMTSQLTAVGAEQVRIAGMFFDAKHQLETQRLFQQLSVRAHKDYTPSEGLCEMGTVARGLIRSERRSDLTKMALAQHSLKRQLANGEMITIQGGISDKESRLKDFIKDYCDTKDNSKGLNLLCKNGGGPKERQNRDIDFVRSLDSKLTLDIELIPANSGQAAAEAKTTPDWENMVALSANLYAHNTLPVKPKHFFANDKGDIRLDSVPYYLDLRSIVAKRSVAVNSFASIAGDRVAGDPEAAPFIKRLIAELGIPEEDVEMIIGKNPSYFAQMEVLTKKIYENPVFYTELYDKPANVQRKAAALKAIGLMQERDIYQSLIRSEMIGSVLLETMLMEKQENLKNVVDPSGSARKPLIQPAQGGSGP